MEVSPQNPLPQSIEIVSPKEINISSPISNHLFTFFLMLFVFLIGTTLGGAFILMYNGRQQPIQPDVVPTAVQKLPSDAVQIQACEDHEGALYIRPQDIPMGPIYMVNNNKVIGIQYMIPQDEFVKGENYSNLQASALTVDHVNVGLIQSGHLGMNTPHYHLTFYAIPKSEEERIICTPGAKTGSMPLMEKSETPGGDMQITPSTLPRTSPSQTIPTKQ